MGDGLSLARHTALEKTGQALFRTTRLGILRGDDADGWSVALLQVGLVLTLGAVQRGLGGLLRLMMQLRWPLMRGSGWRQVGVRCGTIVVETMVRQAMVSVVVETGVAAAVVVVVAAAAAATVVVGDIVDGGWWSSNKRGVNQLFD